MKLSKLLGPATVILTIVAFLALIATAQNSQLKPANISVQAQPPSHTIAKSLVTANSDSTVSEMKPTAQTAEPIPPNPLNAIAWMKGGTWVAEIKDKDGNVATRIETRIRGSENGHLDKFTTTFIEHNRPRLQYEGVYLYDPANKWIALYYTDSEGDFSRGHATFANNTLTQDFEIVHANGLVDVLRSLVVRDGDNAYSWNVMSNKTGAWKEIFRLRYVREKSAEQ